MTTTGPAATSSGMSGTARIGGPPRHRTPLRPRLSSITYVIVGTLLALLFIAPVFYIALRSVLPASADARGIGWNSFATLTLGNYRRIFAPSTGIVTYAKNSFFVGVGTASLVCVVSMLAGYALSRIRLRFSAAIFVIILGPIVVPYQGLLTPLSIVLTQLHLLNSLTGVVLILATLQLPFSVFVMRNTFDGVPMEIEEAALIDGAGTVRMLWTVIVPLTWPGIVTVWLFGFMIGWNDLLTSLVFLTSSSKYTLPMALSSITTSFKIPGVEIVDPGLLTAAACVAMVPVVALFLALQRYYTIGLIKGSLQ
jgi:multiple sugar transport system permease protein